MEQLWVNFTMCPVHPKGIGWILPNRIMAAYNNGVESFEFSDVSKLRNHKLILDRRLSAPKVFQINIFLNFFFLVAFEVSLMIVAAHVLGSIMWSKWLGHEGCNTLNLISNFKYVSSHVVWLNPSTEWALQGDNFWWAKLAMWDEPKVRIWC